MARLYYMSLPGVGDWNVAMRESGAQLAPYRTYLSTARTAAENRALSLAWRLPSDAEHLELELRRSERAARSKRRADEAKRRRDRRAPEPLASGVWIVLQPRPGHGEEPETTFDAFFDARKGVHERPPLPHGKSFAWKDESRIDVVGFDREGRALLLSRTPTEIPAREPEETEVVAISVTLEGPLLFLRPNTWPLDCQRRAIEAIENRPSPRLAPLVRLVSTAPRWERVTPQDLPEPSWVFLRRNADGSLRDGTSEQRDFVQRALGTPDFAVLEGPPGSGKTTAICELIVQLARRHERVLLVASTHVAVDNVLERLMAWQDGADEKRVMPIRIGDEHNVTSAAIGAWTLRNLMKTWSGEILDHLDQPAGATPEGAEARVLLKEALTRKGDDSTLARMLLDASNLVCGTTIGILQHPAIKAANASGETMEPFDMVILDEASKTTFAEFLVPAVYAKRWVVVGDRRQLSPYVEEDDLSENLRPLLSPDLARATVHTFLASSAVPPGRRVRSLIAIRSVEEANLLAEEAEARGVEAIDLDAIEADEEVAYGVAGACADLLCADVVFGTPETIAAWEHRLPGDLHALAGEVPSLPHWEAHRRALGTRPPDEPPSWADEVAWRQIRHHELRYNPAERERLIDDLRELQPRMLDEGYFAHRRPRKLRSGNPQTPAEALEEDLDTMRRVSMPSILEIIQEGAGALGWDRKTGLTDGLPPAALSERMVSLSFQHRMHPDISAFPRSAFYAEDGLLMDAAPMTDDRAWSYPRYARRAVWIDIQPRRGKRGQRTSGNKNLAEVEALMTELNAFVTWAATTPHPGKDPHAPWEVAVLSFYRGQEAELRHRLQQLSGQLGNSRSFQLPNDNGRVHVTLCTVDRFQGHEADVVFLSFVKSGSAGFLNSPNRLDVALTRARYQLVLVGDRSWMASSHCHSDLLRTLGTSPLYARNIAWETP